ncbi:hypothetical protein JCM8202_002019 [Rhodotorula sphaerocarpa]
MASYSPSAVTRACIARGIAPEQWTDLVGQARKAEGTDAETAETELFDCLLDLIAADARPTATATSYLAAAVTPAHGSPLIRAGVAARALLRNASYPLEAAEIIWKMINAALRRAAGAAPAYGAPGDTDLVESLEAVNTVFLPRLLASPTSTLEAQEWLLFFVQTVKRFLASPRYSTELKATCTEGLRSMPGQIDPTKSAAFAQLERSLSDLGSRPTPNKRRRMPASVSLDAPGSPTATVDPDSASLAADLLLRPYVPFDVLQNRLAGLLRYRLDQSPFWGSNPKQGTATALAEVFGSVLWCLHTARTHDAVIESVVYAKDSDTLASGLRLVRAAIEEAIAARADDAPVKEVFDQFVIAVAQQAILSPSDGAELAFNADVADLQPVAVPDFAERFESGDLTVIEATLQEFAHSFPSQASLTASLSSAFALRAARDDAAGLAVLCELVISQQEELSVLMLHMEPCELLAPVRQALDGMTDSARDDGHDGVAIDRCGTLVLFLQVVVHRFQLHGDLCRHLGSTTSFYAAWLRAPDAVFTLASLTEEERIAVSGWISALFGEGISDDLMHATNPNILLKIAPTILKQSVMACRAGVVDLDSLRDAMSYFLQELLRFTLPGVLVWLIGEIQETSRPEHRKILLEVLSVFCFSDALPSSVRELVAPALAGLLANTAATGDLDRLKLLKLIAPHRPSPSPLAWREAREKAKATTSDAAPARYSTFPYALSAEDRDPAEETFQGSRGGNSTLPLSVRNILSLASAESLPFEQSREYGRLERAGAAYLAADPGAFSAFVDGLTDLSADETGAPGLDRPGMSARLAYLGDVVGGALELVDEPTRRRYMQRLAKAVQAQRTVSQRSAASAFLDVIIERMLGWPAVAAEGNRFGTAAGGRES